MSLNVRKEVAAMQRKSVRELREQYEEVFGEACRSNHKEWLIKRIAWRLQANEEGDLTERARRRAEELANDADVRVTPPRDFCAPSAATGTLKTQSQVSIHTDPRIPSVGTSITREYKGRTIEVRVVKDGFEHDGEKYKSLTAVARKISGSHCNGFRFFNLEAN